MGLALQNNKYRRWYNELIARAKNRHLSCYFERHHIKPKALGGGNEKSNIVKLTYREHFLAHWLLTKCTLGVAQQKMFAALAYMTRATSGRTVSSWQFSLARTARVLVIEAILKECWKNPSYRELQFTQQSLSMKNRWKDDDWRVYMERLISAKNRALWQDPSYREKQTKTRRSTAFREGQRKKAKAAWAKAECRKKYLATNSLRTLLKDPMFVRKRIRKFRAAIKVLWQDPIWRANTLAAQAAGRLKKKALQNGQ